MYRAYTELGSLIKGVQLHYLAAGGAAFSSNVVSQYVVHFPLLLTSISPRSSISKHWNLSRMFFVVSLIWILKAESNIIFIYKKALCMSKARFSGTLSMRFHPRRSVDSVSESIGKKRKILQVLDMTWHYTITLIKAVGKRPVQMCGHDLQTVSRHFESDNAYKVNIAKIDTTLENIWRK